MSTDLDGIKGAMTLLLSELDDHQLLEVLTETLPIRLVVVANRSRMRELLYEAVDNIANCQRINDGSSGLGALACQKLADHHRMAKVALDRAVAAINREPPSRD